MAIIGSLPVTLQNGNVNDATQVMTDLNYIVTQVNTNAAANSVSQSGSYTPATSAFTNFSAVTFNVSHVIKVSTVVMVCGSASLTPSAANSSGTITFSLPPLYPTTMTNAYDLSGSFTPVGSNTVAQGGFGGNIVGMAGPYAYATISTGSSTGSPIAFSFQMMYLID